MLQLFKLARRNIWRNKRRTIITVCSILFAVFFATFMKSMQKGTWDNVVNSVVSNFFGYAQIHEKGYWEDLSLNKSMEFNQALQNLADSQEDIQAVVPRLESFALGSHGVKTKGVLVIGIDPVKEDALTQLSKKITAGTYFGENSEGAIIAAGLADYLKITVGDTLVMIGQGFRGVNAAGKYVVEGLVEFGSPELNDGMVYLPLDRAQYLYGAEGRITNLIVDTNRPKQVKEIVANLKNTIGTEKYEVMDWEELIPDLVSARQIDSAGGALFLNILYILISFGIFGTLLMMLKERQYEFGVLLSIGMKKWQIFLMLWFETMVLAAIGVLAGILSALPLVYYLYANPVALTGDMATAYDSFGIEAVVTAAFEHGIFIQQGITIFVIVSILSLYPFFKIRSLHPVKAMRQ